jgi:S-DNA-T family DNA segregation ATPase FtsK/SpoIIIE
VVTLFVLWLQLWLTSDWAPQVPWMVWWWPSSPVQWPWLLWLPWPSWLLLAGAIVWWGYRGRPLDGKPFLQPAAAPTGDIKLTGDIVLRALCSLGIGKMTKPEDIELLYGVKPTRAGYHIDLTLPYGVTAGEVMEKREKLSSGLQRSLGTVWPSVGPRHAGHLQLFISHEDMSTAKQKPWPLLKSGGVNLFRPVPMFTDQKGDWVDMPPLATTCGLVGAVPRMGKTYFQRELSLVCGLDVRCEEYIFELKGTGDLSCAKLYAHYYSDSDEEEDIAEHLEVMRKLVEERRRRAKVIRSLPNDECPRSEVTDELASRRDLGLHPILIEVDECQVWFAHRDKPTRDEFERLADDLVRKGPAVGIMAYFSTQELGKESIPSSVTRNASIRLCFKVNGDLENNRILGNGAYANGYQATMFDFYRDKGIAYLRAEGPPQIVRTVAAMDKVEADKVALRIHNMRKQAGRLTGMAAGEAMEIEAQEVQLLDAIRALFGSAEKMHGTDIAVGLASQHPGMYGSLDVNALGDLLRNMTPPIEFVSVHVPGKGTGKGLKREQLDVATTSETAADDPRNNVRRLRREQ